MAQESSLFIAATKQGVGFSYFCGAKYLFVYRSFSSDEYSKAKLVIGKKTKPVDFSKAYRFVKKLADAQRFQIVDDGGRS